MKITTLGVSGSEIGAHKASGMLLNDAVLLDAGGVVHALPLATQQAIDAVFLTHAHLDHVKDLGFLIDNTFATREHPLRIAAPAEVVEELRAHLFNWILLPDFSVLPTPDKPVMSWRPLDGPATEKGLRFEYCRVNHPGNAYGYCVDEVSTGVSVLFTGDTMTTDGIWELGLSRERLAAMFVDVAFPDRLRHIADASGHFTPGTLDLELERLGNPEMSIYLVHLKPAYLEEIVADVGRLGRGNLEFAVAGASYEFGAGE